MAYMEDSIPIVANWTQTCLQQERPFCRSYLLEVFSATWKPSEDLITILQLSESRAICKTRTAILLVPFDRFHPPKEPIKVFLENRCLLISISTVAQFAIVLA